MWTVDPDLVCATNPESEPMDALRKIASKYPEAEEGIACEGTAAECRTVKARNKAFLFLGETHVMLKLRESLDEAASYAAREPGCCKVGAQGWVKLTFGDGASPPLEVLKRWIDESYRLIAPSQLVALLPGGKPTALAEKKAPKKANQKKKPTSR